MVWKPSEKANMPIHTGLPRPDALPVRTLEEPVATYIVTPAYI